jgi:hypothetical protein
MDRVPEIECRGERDDLGGVDGHLVAGVSLG